MRRQSEQQLEQWLSTWDRDPRGRHLPFFQGRESF